MKRSLICPNAENCWIYKEYKKTEVIKLDIIHKEIEEDKYFCEALKKEYNSLLEQNKTDCALIEILNEILNNQDILKNLSGKI